MKSGEKDKGDGAQGRTRLERDPFVIFRVSIPPRRLREIYGVSSGRDCFRQRNSEELLYKQQPDFSCDELKDG